MSFMFIDQYLHFSLLILSRVDNGEESIELPYSTS